MAKKRSSRRLLEQTQFVENLVAKAKARGERMTKQQAVAEFKRALRAKARGGADPNKPRRRGILG